MTNRLKITADGPLPVKGVMVSLDGAEIQNELRGLRLHMAADRITTVELDVSVVDMTEVDTEVKAFIPAGTRDLLIKIGWTPPAEEAS